MVLATSATRKAHRMMANERALAEQHERHNPVNPRSQLMKNKNGVAGHPVVGGSATPSMGLSQYRGGKKHTLLDHLEQPMEGFGTKKGQMRKTARRAYEPKASEAHEMGLSLSKHIHGLHGAGFWSDFADGFQKGFMGVMKPAMSLMGMGVVSEAKRAKTMLGKMKKGRSRNNGVPLLSGNVNGNTSGGSLDKRGSMMKGMGHNEESESDEECRGGSNTGAYEGHGKMLGEAGHGVAPKRMVGAGVSARAKIVKEVMAKHGLKMIEASKYVKEHGLYKK